MPASLHVRSAPYASNWIVVNTPDFAVSISYTPWQKKKWYGRVDNHDAACTSKTLTEKQAQGYARDFLPYC